jgi:hypothetical protein
MKRLACVIAILSTTGCAIVSPSFVGTPRTEKRVKDVQMFFRLEDVPFPYTVIGKVYVKNINYWADRDPGEQAKAIRSQAAEAGADAVIIEDGKRFESSFNNAGTVYQLSGLAIARKVESESPKPTQADGRL